MDLFYIDEKNETVTWLYMAQDNEENAIYEYKFSFEEIEMMADLYSVYSTFFDMLIETGNHTTFEEDDPDYIKYLNKFYSGNHDFEGLNKETMEGVLLAVQEKEKTEFKLRIAKKEEQKYTELQDNRLNIKTGCVCDMKADFGPSGTIFFSIYDDHNILLAKMDWFKEEFNKVIEALRFDEKHNGMLYNLQSLEKYCKSKPQAQINSEKNIYGFRLDVGKFSYLICCRPYSADYNFSCIVYDKHMLDSHIENARYGIRFVDDANKDKFTIVDGAEIRLTMPNGDYKDVECRYLDDFHARIGEKYFYLKYFAEEMAEKNISFAPFRKSLAERIITAERLKKPTQKDVAVSREDGKRYFYKLTDVSEIKARFLKEEGYKCLHKVRLYTQEEYTASFDKKMMWPVHNPDENGDKKDRFINQADAYKALIKMEQKNRGMSQGI